MKRTALLLIFILLLMLPLSGLAKDRPDPAALAAQLTPAYTFLCGETDRTYAWYLAQTPEGDTVFVGCSPADGAWQASVSTPLPEGAELNDFERPPVIGYYRPDLPEEPWIAHTITCDGEVWRISDSTMNHADLICYEEHGLSSDLYGDWLGEFTLPLEITAVDWLALPVTYEEAMLLTEADPGQDMAAVLTPADWDERTIDPALTAFGEAHLPEYAVTDGKVFEGTCVLLAEGAEGLVFIGGVKVGEAWRFTVSTPLPEGSSCDSFHAGKRSMCLWVSLPRALQNPKEGLFELGAYAGLMDDGSWQVYTVNTGWEYVSLYDEGIHSDNGGSFFGDVTLERDVTAIDWLSLPRTAEEALTLANPADWFIVQRNGAPMRLTDGSTMTLNAGVPLRLIRREGTALTASVYGTDLTGSVQEADLIPAESQIVWNDGEWRSRFSLPVLWLGGALIECTDMPHGGSVVYTQQTDRWDRLDALGLCSEGCCCLVRCTREQLGFIRLDSLTAGGDEPQTASGAPLVHDSIDLLRLMAAGLPAHTSLVNAADEDSAALLMQQPDGTRAFVGARRTGTGWVFTVSAPLPENAWYQPFASGPDAFTLTIDGLRYGVGLDAYGCWRVTRVGGFAGVAPGLWQWAEDGLFIGPAAPEIAQADWAALPALLQHAIKADDAWRIVTANDATLTSRDGATVHGTYQAGTPVRVWAEEDGLCRVSVMNGLMTGWMRQDQLATAQELLSGASAQTPSLRLTAADPDALHYIPAPGSMLTLPDFSLSALQLLGRTEEGWHVYDWQAECEAFIAVESCTTE